jgi:DNA-binding FadR family transcriptional regulator
VTLPTMASTEGGRTVGSPRGQRGRSKVTALSRRSLADQVADAIVQLILDEGLGDGSPLPATADLSERFNVSRTVTREALATLTGQGILTRSQGRESVVSTPGLDTLSRLLQFRVRNHNVSPLEVLEFRLGLEVMAAASAARKRTPEDVAELRALLAALAGAKNDKAYHQADIALHQAIARASGNTLVVLVLDALVDLLRDMRITATKRRRARGVSLDGVVVEHRRIVEAIEAGDPVAAEGAMREHLSHTAEELAR